MRKFILAVGILFLAMNVMVGLPCSTFAQTSSGFSLTRVVICSGVENREPIGAAETFSPTTEKVYCFLEAANITEDTQIDFVWYFGQKVVGRITLPLKKSGRWRTYTSKKLAGLKGDWKVEIQDAQGKVLKTVNFKVE